MTAETLTLVSAIIAAIGVLVAMWTLIIQAHQNRLALGASFIHDIEKEFLWSDRMQEQRLAIAQFFQNQQSENDAPPSAVAHMLDWLDQIGLYHRKGVIDLEMTWTTLFYWYGHYWVLLESFAERYESNAGGITFYQNARELFSDLCTYGNKKRNLPSPTKYFNEERLTAFIDEEIRQCSKT
jgi:hypothetical protein